MVHLNFDSRLKKKNHNYFFSSQVTPRLYSSFSFYTWFPHLYKQPSLIIVLTQHISAFPNKKGNECLKKPEVHYKSGGRGGNQKNANFVPAEKQGGGKKENNKLYTTWTVVTQTMETPTSQACDLHPERLSVDTLGSTVTAEKLAV